MNTVPISVVVPAYNSEEFIGEAIRSIQSQSVCVNQIIVVDNNCTDNTKKISEDLGVEVVREKRQGISAARNKGISVCKNDWVAFLDSDDVWDKEKIGYQWNAIQKFPKAPIISSDSGRILEPDKTKHTVPTLNELKSNIASDVIIDGVYSFCQSYVAEFCEWFWINSSTMIFHKEVFDVVGLFDEKFSYAQDLEFTSRALAKFPVATVKKNLAYIRLHNNNRTNNQNVFTEFKVRVIEQMRKYPQKYPLGMAERLIKEEKRIFLERGSWLAKKKREQSF